MVNGKFSPGNFSGTKWAREVSGGNLLHPDTFSDFPEPHPAVPCSGKFTAVHTGPVIPKNGVLVDPPYRDRIHTEVLWNTPLPEPAIPVRYYRICPVSSSYRPVIPDGKIFLPKSLKTRVEGAKKGPRCKVRKKLVNKKRYRILSTKCGKPVPATCSEMAVSPGGGAPRELFLPSGNTVR